MNKDQVAVAEECTALSRAGKIAFPDVVRKLHAAGIERYHADLCRAEKTYYLATGEFHVVGMGALPGPPAQVFSASAVETAIREIQRGAIVYMEFLREIMAAGCVGYLVHIAGRNALYLGRGGEMFLEPFPAAK